ncbi:SUR7/PalI family-domain-containing protein [Nemania sp. FL0031]|nr:SUR7/PalI family-domain-containing protein [Nemania sp. FL0031]
MLSSIRANLRLGHPFADKHKTPSYESMLDKECQNGGHESIEVKAGSKRRFTARRNAIILSCLFYLSALVLLILVEMGNTQKNETLGNIFLFRLDLTNVLARSVPSGVTSHDSIARSTGLRGFYQAGLWNFCEGYKDTGFSSCSKPSISFWFDPTEVLPQDIVKGANLGASGLGLNDTLLNIFRILYRTMFGLFLSGAALTALLLVSSPVVLYSRWGSVMVMVMSLITTLVVIAAASLSTAISYLFQMIVKTETDVGAQASVGTWMLGFEWSAAALTLLACMLHVCVGWSGRSRRKT